MKKETTEERERQAEYDRLVLAYLREKYQYVPDCMVLQDCEMTREAHAYAMSALKDAV